MSTIMKILFNEETAPISLKTIKKLITDFPYTDTSEKVIRDSYTLDKEGNVFLKNASLVLSNFGMTRSGRFKDPAERQKILKECWNSVGERIFKIHQIAINGDYNRDRFLLEVDSRSRENIIDLIWAITKELLPMTMGKTAYGLVGASKILFSILPEIVLPTDNKQFLRLFQTVDLGDIIRGMTTEIQHWEDATGERLNEMDNYGRLTTLPSVYNVMAMEARTKE